MPKQLSLILDIPQPNNIGPAPEDQNAINRAGIATCRRALETDKQESYPTQEPEGWGPHNHRSLGAGWIEDLDGEILPPEGGNTFDCDPAEYERHLLELAHRAATRAGIAACRAIIWEKWLRDRDWKEPDWARIRAETDAEHSLLNAA